jgi:hypothetical protein
MTRTQTRKANQYAGQCSKCHGHVPAGAGYLGGKVNGRWTVEHINCSTQYGRSPFGRCPTGGDCLTFGIKCHACGTEHLFDR